MRNCVSLAALSLSMIVSACGGASSAEPTTPPVEERLPAPPQTTFDRIHALNYPFTVRCNLAHLREAWPDLVGHVHTTAMDAELERALGTLTTVVVATDANEKAVAFVGTTDEGIFQLRVLADLRSSTADLESVPGGAIMWNREKPAPPAVRELLQLAAREMPSDAICEASFNEDLVRQMAGRAQLEEPALGADAPTRLAWDLHFMQDWRGAWHESDGSFDADFDSTAHATATVTDLRETLEYARQQIGQLASLEPRLEPIGVIVMDVLARTEVRSSHQRVSVIVPMTIPSLNEIATHVSNFFAQQRREASSQLARMQVHELSQRVGAWSLTHPTAARARRSPPFPAAPRTATPPPLTTEEINAAYNVGTTAGAAPPPENWGGAWAEYQFLPPRYADHLELEVSAVGDDVTVHAYTDLDEDGIFAHYQMTGHRNRADASVTWAEITVTDEFE